MSDLKDLLRENVATPPPDRLDLAAVVGAGQRRVRSRRRTTYGALALATATVVAATGLALGAGDGGGGGEAEPATRPAPVGPTLRLSDATPAVEGRDYETVASHTNRNLDAANGSYLDGVTEDGRVLLREGPRDANGWRAGYALLDPATGRRESLPDPGVGQEQAWPVVLDDDRLVLLTFREYDPGDEGAATFAALVLDRVAGTWTTVEWPGLPATDGRAVLGPDGRLYARVPATRGRVPEGGWPTQEGGDAEDADAEGDTFDLWSVSLDDPADVRDEGLRVGDVAFTDTAMVWTDRAGGDPGRVHVRDRATGTEHDFDPQVGERCNLLSFGAYGDRIAMGQYCGTYGDVRDDRVQVLTTDGDQVATLQDSGVEGWLPAGNRLVTISSWNPDGESGTFVYDLETDRFLRISDALSNWGLVGHGPDGTFTWHTPVNRRHGATQSWGRLLD